MVSICNDEDNASTMGVLGSCMWLRTHTRAVIYDIMRADSRHFCFVLLVFSILLKDTFICQYMGKA